MPILHTQFAAEGKRADGKVIHLPPTTALQIRGPVVQVSVSVEQNIAQQLLQAGTTLPPPITGFALIDTGASMTCIDDEAAQSLRLPVIDVAKMASASHDSTDCNIYPIQIDVPGINLKIGVPRAMGAALKSQNFFEPDAIGPSRRASVPSPATAPDVAG